MAAKEKMIWIKNNHVAGIRARYVSKVGEKETEGTVTFARESTNRISGQVESRGYTCISESVYDALMETSKIFKDFVEQKKLVRYDEAPEDALTDAEHIAMLESENADLKAKLSGAESAIRADIEAEYADIEKAVTELTEANANLTNANTVLKGSLDEANAHIEKLTADFEAYKKANPAKRGSAS